MSVVLHLVEMAEVIWKIELFFFFVNKLFLFAVSLGNSWEFRPIWALEISADPESTQPTVPKIRYVAGVHGNTAAGPELLLEFASLLCINYGGNPIITKVGVTSLQNFFFF